MRPYREKPEELRCVSCAISLQILKAGFKPIKMAFHAWAQSIIEHLISESH